MTSMAMEIFYTNLKTNPEPMLSMLVVLGPNMEWCGSNEAGPPHPTTLLSHFMAVCSSTGTEDVANGGGLHNAALLMSWWKVGIKLVDLNSPALTFQICFLTSKKW